MLSRVCYFARPKQLLVQSCFALRKAGESKGHRLVQGRWMSSLGNPMFPQRPLPELETFHESIENSKKAKKESGGGDPGNKGVVDILADHGGKIALVVLAGVIALVYSYYLSGKDRNKIEDAISEAVFVEPYEIQELRFGNRLSTEEYRFIAAQAKAAFPTGQATYADFMKYLKRDLVIPSAVRSAEEAQSQPAGSQRRGVVWRNGQGRLDLLSTHLLDRMVMGLCLAQANAAASVAPTAGSAGAENPPASADAGAERSVAWAETPLDVTTLLAMLSLAMVPDAEARLQALHSLAAATAGDSSSSGSSGSSSQESSDALAVSETATRGDVLRLIRALIETDQIPPAKQTMESGVKWPVKLYRRKGEEDMVKEYEVRKKITTPVEAYDYEAFRELLLSYQVCAWGECYNKDDHR